MTDIIRHVDSDDLDDSEASDRHVQSLLAQLDADAAEMSSDDLASLRSETLTAVATKMKATAHRKFAAIVPVIQSNDAGFATRHLLGARAMAVFTALASLLFAVWLLSPTTARAETTLSELLHQLRDASSVTMQILKPDGMTFVTLKAPGVVRWDDGDGQYRVADSHRLWRVNDATGEITDEPSPLPSEGLNALSLLELTDLESSAQATLQTTYEVLDGESYAVREAQVQMARQPAVLRAFTDEATGRIRTLHLLSASERALLAEVRLTSLNELLPSDAFRITRSLKDDGRAGVISEIHGLVFVRAFPGHRWTPATNTLPLFVGDQIRCEARGANAAVIRLMSGTEITLGPSGLLEIGPEKLRLLNGDVKVESRRLAPPRRALQGASGHSSAESTKLASLHSDHAAANAEPLSQANTLEAHLAERDGYSSRLAPPRRALQGASGNPSAGTTNLTSLHSNQAAADAVQLNHGNTLEAHLAERDGYIEGPDGITIEINDTAFYRTTGSPPTLQKLDNEPTWFKTLSENLTAETMGSLIAQVDGRDVSLTLGFHHVTVEIRDQIARTVIEESFVNNTDQRLEGQFHFPLPHDASISGFGMWIGDQLIEADVVEKQRASEIYETILREKRDPGLLEWEGGNIFKARVFPIEAHGEKKLRITYTQTLPLKNGTFRYHYPLRSELLQKTPLRDLAIDLTIQSSNKIARLECPSHGEPTREPLSAAVDAKASSSNGIRQVGDVTIEQTENSARIHYEARNITPGRDFEVLCSLDSRQADVVAIPHVRGKDGYFQLQLSPPSIDAGNWSRMMVRDGTPLDVILVCDTSRSMDKAARDKQHDLVATLLSSLSESDRIRVACCDVKTSWLLKEPGPATEQIRNAVLEKLEQRRSLGWSDLQRCFASILEAAGEKTHVIYIGDGTVVAEDSQAGSAFASWFNVARVTSRKEPTCHAIAVGNAYDMTVLSAIGRKGSGTTRVCSYSTSATDTVRDLLFEITRPGLRDLKVEFRNVQVAAVYPAELPNLPDGMQHIITGRFLPSTNDAAGEVIVTGRRGDELVKYVARMPLHETRKQENSFIPRLWAKKHIDHLLQEASTPEIKQQIIALSQEFHLITPLTSLLVLETDADRKRFGVERTMHMRDGEQFFAEGRKEAEYSLRQQQLETAKLWRQKLHDQMRAQISRFGREEFENSHFTLPQSQNEFSFSVPLNRLTGRQLSRGSQLLREELLREGVDDGTTLYVNDTQDEFVALRGESRGFNEGELFFDQLANVTERFSTLSDDSVVLENTPGDQFSKHRFDAVNAWDIVDAPNLPYLGYSNDTVLPPPDYLSDDVQYFGNSGGLTGATIANNFISTRGYLTRRGSAPHGYLSQSENKYYAGHYLTLDILDGTSSPKQDNKVLVEPPTFGVRNVLPSAKVAEPNSVEWPEALRKLVPAIVFRQPAVESTASAEFNTDWPSDVLDVMKSVDKRFEKLNGGLVLKHVEQTLHPTRQSSRLAPPRRALQGASGNPSAGTTNLAPLHSDQAAADAEPYSHANPLKAHLAERDGYRSRLAPPRRALQGASGNPSAETISVASSHSDQAAADAETRSQANTLEAHLAERDGYRSRLAPPRRALQGASGNSIAETTNLASLRSDQAAANAETRSQANTLEAHLAERDGYRSRLAPPRRALQGASGNPSAGTTNLASLHSDHAAADAETRSQANTLEAHLAERDGYVSDWNTITWLPSLGWSWEQKSSLGPIRRWSIGDSSGAVNEFEKLGHYADQSQAPEKCSLPYEFVNQRYGNPADSIWADWQPQLESRNDASAVILMTHRTKPWEETRLLYDLSKRCALQQDTLTDGIVVSQIKLSEHRQVADSWIATQIEIRELEPLSNELVTTSRHTLELREISADEAKVFLQSRRLAAPRQALQGASGNAGEGTANVASFRKGHETVSAQSLHQTHTLEAHLAERDSYRSRLAPPRRALQVTSGNPIAGTTNLASLHSDHAAAEAEPLNNTNTLEAHLAERDGYIMLPRTLPSASTAKKAIEAGNATLADKFARIFELWHQSRWDEAIPLIDKTLNEHQLTESGLWIRHWLTIDARRMEETRLEIQRLIESLNDEKSPLNTIETDLLRAKISRLRTFAQWTMSDHDYESAIRILISKADQFGLDLLEEFMNERIQVLIKLRRVEEAKSLRVEMLKRLPDNLAILHGVVEDLRSHRRHDDVRNLLESSVAANRRWTLAEWNVAFQFYLNWLRQRGEFESGLTLCERWIGQCRTSESAYEHKLRSLIELDRANDVKALLAEWFESSRLAPPRRALQGALGNPGAGTTNVASLHSDLEAADAQSLNHVNTLKAHLVERDGYIDPVVLAQINAAMEFGFGRVAGLELDGPQREFEPQMLTLAEFFAASDRRLDIADKVLGHSAIVKTASGKAMMNTFLQRLTADLIEKISSARLEAIFRWIQNSGIHGDVRETWLHALRTHLDQSLPTMDLKRGRILLMTYGLAVDLNTPIEQRQKWLDVLIGRWRSIDNIFQRGELASLIEEFEDQAFDAAHQIKWQRTRLMEAKEFETSAAANGLFQKLLATSWSPEVENETWSLLELIPFSTAPHTRRNEWIPLLQQWVTSMLSMRVVHHQNAYPGFNDLPAKQQQHAARECRVRAMREMIDVLTEKGLTKQNETSNAADQVSKDTEGSRPAARHERADDILLHRLMLQAELAEADTIAGVTDEERTRQLDGVIRDAKILLGPEPELTPDPNSTPVELEKQIEQQLALRQRHFAFALWLNAAVKRDELQSKPQSRTEQVDEIEASQANSHISEVLNYVRKGIEKDKIAPDAWRAAEYGILIALDRSDELLGRLQEWAATQTTGTPWTVYLAQLLVELDRLEEAIDLYEVRGDKDLMTVNEWHQLSLWHHALDHRAASERSKRMAWARTPSNELQKQLTNELEQWNSGGIEKTPTAPENVKVRFAILLPKTEHPDHAIRLLANWYKATHDAQLLISMAPFLTGQSRGKMWNVLEYTQSAINDVDQEAGIDAIKESIRQAEIRVKSAADRPQSEIDLLALNILSLQTTSAGAKITNQPGSHVERATSILGQLLKHNWQPDERLWFALRLHNLPINNASLKQTRLEGMKTLLQAVPEGSTERLQIAKLTAQIMITEKNDDDALRLLEAEINIALGMLSKQDAGTSADPELVVDLVRTQVRLLHEARQYRASERWLTETTSSIVIPDREELLFETHVSALLHGGQTSLGEKSTLYESLKNQTLTRVLEAGGSDEFQRAWRQLFQVLRSGQHQQIKAVAVDTLAIANTHATNLVRQHSDRDDEIIDAILKLLNETNQRQAAIEFLLERLESQPLALQWTAPRRRWNNFADDLYVTAVQTKETKVGGKRYGLYPEAIPLRDRFEDVLFLGLEKTFAVLGDQHSELFSADRDGLWKDGNKRFLEVINRVVAANQDSQPHLMHLANRLISHHHGQRENAIRILRSANERKVLDVNGQNQLVNYLFDAQNFQDAVPVLEDIIRAYPKDTTPRISLMTALYKLGERERLLAELNNILRELVNPVTADVQQVWSLADSCRECELWKEASDLYHTGITRHGWPRTPSALLSDAWRNLAECQVRLHQTAEALNSISAAWVVCGQDANRRSDVQLSLASVMGQTQDLTNVTQLLDQKAAEDGEDSSFLRRALGKAMLDQRSFESAEAQLRIALSLQQQDHEAWTWLIAALDGQGRSAEAANAVQDQSDINIRNISLYHDLHQRLATLNLSDEAERAATSLIEVAMSEADHHMSLAQIRESQNLQSSAVQHWQIAADLRKEDPTPLVGLAKAQIQIGDPAAARRTLNRLVIGPWDERFTDLPNELRSIRRQLRKQEEARR